jgi:hypothetical protein
MQQSSLLERQNGCRGQWRHTPVRWDVSGEIDVSHGQRVVGLGEEAIVILACHFSELQGSLVLCNGAREVAIESVDVPQ